MVYYKGQTAFFFGCYNSGTILKEFSYTAYIQDCCYILHWILSNHEDRQGIPISHQTTRLYEDTRSKWWLGYRAESKAHKNHLQFCQNFEHLRLHVNVIHWGSSIKLWLLMGCVFERVDQNDKSCLFSNSSLSNLVPRSHSISCRDQIYKTHKYLFIFTCLPNSFCFCFKTKQVKNCFWTMTTIDLRFKYIWTFMSSSAI